MSTNNSFSTLTLSANGPLADGAEVSGQPLPELRSVGTEAFSSVRSAATAYAQHGLRVHKIVRGDKVPPKDYPWKDGSPPDAFTESDSIGVQTGQVSGVIVLDVDTDKGATIPPNLPATWQANTGSGGHHFFFRYPGHPVHNSRAKIGVGLDIRGEGGYVVAAPSPHPSGRSYSWAPGRAPGEVALADLPADLAFRIALADRPANDPVCSEPDDEILAQYTSESAMEVARAYLEEVPGAISGEGGHDQTFDAACRAVERSLSREDAWDVLSEWNQTSSPPWNDHDLKHKLDGALAKHQLGSKLPVLVEWIEEDAPSVSSPGQESGPTGPAPLVEAYSSSVWSFGPEHFHNNPPPAKFIYAGVPAAPGKVCQLAGPGGGGKSSWLMGFCLHAIHGLPYLGQPTTKAKILIVSREDDREDYWRKFVDWQGVIGDKFDQATVSQSLKFVDQVGCADRLVKTGLGKGDCRPNYEVVESLAETAKRHLPDASLIILETVSRFAGPEDNEGLSALVSACEALGRERKCSVMLVHHTGKQQARDGTRDSYAGRGGSAIADNCRAVITLTYYPEKKKGVSRKDLGPELPDELAKTAMVYTVAKLNGAKKPKPILLQPVDGNYSMTFRAITDEIRSKYAGPEIIEEGAIEPDVKEFWKALQLMTPPIRKRDLQIPGMGTERKNKILKIALERNYVREVEGKSEKGQKIKVLEIVPRAEWKFGGEE
jgi:hypothetical protein